ncbi:MAG: S9 family peptidase [Thermoanaerobaculia bacterium]
MENDAPHFAPGEGEVPPVWAPDRSVLYGIGDGAPWQVDPGSGEAREIARVDGWEFRSLVTSWYRSPVAWSPNGGDRLWLFARQTDGRRSGIVSVDPATGEARVALEEERRYSHVFSEAASRATGRIVFVSRNQQQPGEIWSYDVDAGAVRQVSTINEELGRYALGEARLIRWTSDRGEALAGALLLPPDYEPGQRLPLVVWVYGGRLGSGAVDRFGFWGSLPALNMHVLATRGYAVLAPDAPLRPGHITEALVETVLPGVDAAVEEGYADPERLAIMGQSFGALNTLALLTRTDRFKAAVITAAVQVLHESV